MRFRLNKIELKGYKSISPEGQTIPLNDDVTVLIGSNGVGKSNVVSFFQLLSYAMSGSLQNYIGENGFADAFLYYGSKTTDCIKARLHFSDSKSQNEYYFRLAYAAGDTLIYTDERLTFQDTDHIHGNLLPCGYTKLVCRTIRQLSVIHRLIIIK